VSGFPRDLLQLVAAEEVVLLAAGAVRAPQAADEKHGHTHRYHNGKGISVGRKPVNQTAHTEGDHTANSKILLCRKAHGQQIELQSAETRPEATDPAKVFDDQIDGIRRFWFIIGGFFGTYLGTFVLQKGE
jgi:hypothetical protein